MFSPFLMQTFKQQWHFVINENAFVLAFYKHIYSCIKLFENALSIGIDLGS